jgi:hypothetical protein
MAADSVPTLPKEEPTGQIHEVPKDGPKKEPVHNYNAAAQVLSASLEHPVTREVEREAHVKLRPDGTYKFQPTGPLRLEGILSYQSGYTQVGGHKSPKEGHGFVTLSTSVVEGLNILDVLTADRVVAQISTEHPVWDDRGLQVPAVTFLGTRFENLRIDGHEVELETQFDILGAGPKNNTPYHEDEQVIRRAFKHYDALPDWAKDKQHGWHQVPGGQRYGDLKCSLVAHIDKKRGTPKGHVIDLPHFGKIFLAELTVNRQKAEPSSNGQPNPETYYFHLEMVRVELGCLAQGSATIVTADSNGGGSGTGHH